MDEFYTKLEEMIKKHYAPIFNNENCILINSSSSSKNKIYVGFDFVKPKFMGNPAVLSLKFNNFSDEDYKSTQEMINCMMSYYEICNWIHNNHKLVQENGYKAELDHECSNPKYQLTSLETEIRFIINRNLSNKSNRDFNEIHVDEFLHQIRLLYLNYIENDFPMFNKILLIMNLGFLIYLDARKNGRLCKCKILENGEYEIENHVNVQEYYDSTFDILKDNY